MAVKKLGANERCGCGSGEKYKRCCQRKSVAWFVDERGIVIDGNYARFSPKLRRYLEETYARANGGDVMTTYAQAEATYNGLTMPERVDYLMGLGLPSDLIYAYQKTGIFLPHKWFEWFRLTNVIPMVGFDATALGPAMEALVEYDRMSGADVPDPEYLTVDDVLAEAQKHKSTMDKSGRRHMMQPTECRGCALTKGLLTVLGSAAFDKDALLVSFFENWAAKARPGGGFDGISGLDGYDGDEGKADRD